MLLLFLQSPFLWSVRCSEKRTAESAFAVEGWKFNHWKASQLYAIESQKRHPNVWMHAWWSADSQRILRPTTGASETFFCFSSNLNYTKHEENIQLHQHLRSQNSAKYEEKPNPKKSMGEKLMRPVFAWHKAVSSSAILQKRELFPEFLKLNAELFPFPFSPEETCYNLVCSLFIVLARQHFLVFVFGL